MANHQKCVLSKAIYICDSIPTLEFKESMKVINILEKN